MTTPADARRSTVLFVVSLVLTFVFMRIWLGIRPNADFNVAGYNIHHLFTGVLIATATAVPLVIGVAASRVRDILVIGFGVGLSLVLDEWVYLIATPGTNADYLLPISLHGGMIMIALGAVYAVVYYWLAARRRRSGSAPRA
jgi:hypothetical protein